MQERQGPSLTVCLLPPPPLARVVEGLAAHVIDLLVDEAAEEGRVEAGGRSPVQGPGRAWASWPSRWLRSKAGGEEAGVVVALRFIPTTGVSTSPKCLATADLLLNISWFAL